MKTPIYNFSKAFWVSILLITSVSIFAQGPQLKWSQAGPIYTAGRARNMVVDNTNKSTLYVGSVSSGIFKSTNGGSLWAPLNDQGKVRNISYLAQSANSTLWVGTGEGFIRYGQKAKALPGTGLYKLVGNDLILAASSTVIGNVINRIACHPTDANKLALTTNKGIYISTDGGSTFSNAQIPNLKTDTAYGMDVKFASNGDLYCTVGNERGHSPYGIVNGRIFKSTNLTVFTNITPTSNVLADANYGRIELAIAPSNPQIIYASCANKNLTAPTGAQSLNSASLKAIFVSYDGGSNWSLVLAGSAQLDPLSSSGVISTGDYAHVLLVDPDDSNKLYIGGYNFYTFKRSNATSDPQVLGTWNQLGNPFARNTPLFLNANTHDIQIVKSGSSSIFYFVTDAGIYRSSDITSAVMLPSFQPFYKGFVTGQFNSVSIERYPLSPNAQTASNGSSVTPLVGFLGGTGGNGMTYYSGSESTVSQETNYLSGEIYNVEYSKILSNAALLSSGNGALYKTSNVKNTIPTLYDYNKYTGNVNKLSPEALSFGNTNMSTGTPFKLWENYGQVNPSPDMAVFYNDTLRVPTSITNFSVLNSQTQFTFAVPRPSRFSAIDSMVIRTGTVVLPLGYSFSNCPTPFTGSDLKDITVKLPNTYTSSLTSTNVVSSSITTGPAQGAISCTLNPLTKLDFISVNFSSAPFATKTITTYTHSAGDITDPSVYYRVFATIYYKYKTGDTISVTDNSISTMINTYKTVLTKPLSWAYGSLPVYTLTSGNNASIPSSTFVLNPGNISQSGMTFTVSPRLRTSYTITQLGTYNFTANPIQYTLSASVNTAITNSTFQLAPGNITNTTGVFNVASPSVATQFTITQTGTGTSVATSTFAIGNPTYILNPGAISQSIAVFSGLQPTSTTVYTLTSVSANTLLAAANTNTTYTGSVATTFSSVGSPTVLFSANNPLIKIPTSKSARLAMILNNSNVTTNPSNPYAIVVSKAPLNLNDPLNFVRISQSGCLSDSANGNPSTNTISIIGRPIMLEWSKSGTELYYATDSNRVYRVSHITDIFDLSPASYSGKFYTDVFTYTTPVNSNTANVNSPYRTTLIGKFDRPITSISVSNDNKNVVLTFNNPDQSGSTGIVMYNSNDARTSNTASINWVKKDDSNLKNNATYCSLIEKDDSKKVFIGTDNGIFYTSDITASPAVWSNVNNNMLPNVQIFDIKQQTFPVNYCYNSGQIYVATNGRGIWTNSDFFSPQWVGIEPLEFNEHDKMLHVFPNPSSGSCSFKFFANTTSSVCAQISDVRGAVIYSEIITPNETGEQTVTLQHNDLKSGLYFISLKMDDGQVKFGKLIVQQ